MGVLKNSIKDKKEFIYHQYHRCDIFIYRGQTCFSSRFIEYIIENLQNKCNHLNKSMTFLIIRNFSHKMYT